MSGLSVHWAAVCCVSAIVSPLWCVFHSACVCFLFGAISLTPWPAAKCSLCVANQTQCVPDRLTGLDSICLRCCAWQLFRVRRMFAVRRARPTFASTPAAAALPSLLWVHWIRMFGEEPGRNTLSAVKSLSMLSWEFACEKHGGKLPNVDVIDSPHFVIERSLHLRLR